MDMSKLQIYEAFKEYLVSILDRVYKYQTAYNACLNELYEAGMLPVYSAGFINLKKQYLTIGINGLNQAAEFLGMTCNKNSEYRDFCNLIFSTIKEQNTAHKTKTEMFNTEFTPCESASIKMYNRDKKDGYWVPDDTNLYASYIFKPNDLNISVLDKLYLHGAEYCGDMLDGGSAAHINLEEHLSSIQYEKLIKYAAEVGCKYFTFNIPNCECEKCGFIAKNPLEKCPKCGSTELTLWDRVIGYLTAIKNWSEGRRIEQKTRVYHGRHTVCNE
jgi:ribonucleoside-triphosphate reductase